MRVNYRLHTSISEFEVAFAKQPEASSFNHDQLSQALSKRLFSEPIIGPTFAVDSVHGPLVDQLLKVSKFDHYGLSKCGE